MKLLLELTPTTISIIITIGVLAIILIGILVFFLIWKKRKNSSPKEETPASSDLAELIVKASGGKENITSVSFKMTRLTLGIKTSSTVNTELLKDIKAIVMETKITYIVGSEADSIASNIESLIK